MANRIDTIHVRNFRSLADVEVRLGDINVLFGRNGAGKSSFLDTVWFARDCAVRSVELASSARSHGIGLLYDGAPEDALLELTLISGPATYELRFGLSSGRIEPFPGEKLTLTNQDLTLIDRAVGMDKVSFHQKQVEAMTVTLREPQKLSLTRYVDSVNQPPPEAEEMDRVLRFVHKWDARRFYLGPIKMKGSESSHETHLWDFGGNLWSVLRNLRDKAALDSRYETIMRYMREAFPSSFEDVVLESTGPTTVYGSFLEKDRRKPILASGVSDGHLQTLLLLTALFSEGDSRGSLMLFDEPEISLHPWAIAVIARAMREAATEWNKQILLATHSPVLLSQFEPEAILVCEPIDGRTTIRRVSEVEEVIELLKDYTVGSLYMSEALAPQGPAPFAQPAGEGGGHAK